MPRFGILRFIECCYVRRNHEVHADPAPAAARATLDDIKRRRARLLRSLEQTDDDDGALGRDIRARVAELAGESCVQSQPGIDTGGAPPLSSVGKSGGAHSCINRNTINVETY
jgi:hypothetical protein